HNLRLFGHVARSKKSLIWARVGVSSVLPFGFVIFEYSKKRQIKKVDSLQVAQSGPLHAAMRHLSTKNLYEAFFAC
ncbi:MAG: hypothetical protein PHZ05_00260, partial [Pygmaiobacter massiliensis]|nr:hypothetical protein [Pygmaiobacter massiliensis]